jgi:hypothetical protein
MQTALGVEAEKDQVYWRENLILIPPSIPPLIPLQLVFLVYDNEITLLIDIYFLQISFTPSNLFRHPV